MDKQLGDRTNVPWSETECKTLHAAAGFILEKEPGLKVKEIAKKIHEGNLLPGRGYKAIQSKIYGIIPPVPKDAAQQTAAHAPVFSKEGNLAEQMANHLTQIESLSGQMVSHAKAVFDLLEDVETYEQFAIHSQKIRKTVAKYRVNNGVVEPIK